MKRRRITPSAAPRIALAAQGFHRVRPGGRVDRRHFRRALRDMQLLQLDSVNVVSRSHYLPMYARLGAYDRTALDDWANRSGELFEYWGHEASLLPVADQPLLRWRMENETRWRRVIELRREHPGYIEAVAAEVADRGPLGVGDLEDAGGRTGPWWGYGKGKIALEYLFAMGIITAYRTKNFARLYDIPERVLPRAVLDAPTPSMHEAYKALLMKSASAYGVGTAADLIDYYRLHGPTARPILADLAERGSLVEVDVDGWKGPVYLHPEATRPHRITGSAFLSPFDPVVWFRDRCRRLFGFRYRIEIYVPKPDRIHGYYVLPYLLDGELVGRVDLKLDRAGARLLVPGAFVEDGGDPQRVGRHMAADLTELATWLGAGDVVIGGHGNLSEVLGGAIG